jgi:hypothetical protein
MLKRMASGHGLQDQTDGTDLWGHLTHSRDESDQVAISVIIRIISGICLRLCPLRSGCGPSFYMLGSFPIKVL